ncbi:peptide deformylase [Euzebya sp.]|uniref:peptide deformylase n=1 Tax=Euzebya sp. TaxID=1971409 RepID=UPI003513BA68
MPLPRLGASSPGARPTAPPCPRRGGGALCAPLNRVWLLDAGPRLARAWAGCTCGTRFGIGAAADAWRAHSDAADRPDRSAWLDAEALRAVVEGVPDAGRRVPRAAPGVVPVGEPVIHAATAWVDPADPAVAELAQHMLAVMDAAPGIGLAANQVGAGLRVIALNFPKLIPQVWVNPVAVSTAGEWTFAEGCLSLEVEGSTADVVRPKAITVVADLPGGGHVVVEADEMLARVIQHELDHLEGIEYVQRLEGAVRDEVYDRLEADGVDTDLLPPRPLR